MEENYTNLLNKAYDYHCKGDYSLAKELYEKLLETNNKDTNLMNLYAQLCVSLKDYDTAIKYFNEVYDLTNLDDVKISISKVYFYKKDYKQTIQILEGLKNKSLEVLKILALSFFYLEEYQSAINIYLEIMNLNSISFSDLYNLSLSYFKILDFDNSLKYALSAYNINNSDLDINLHISSIYKKLKDMELELKYLINAYKISKNLDILIQIGTTYKNLKEDEKAIEVFNMVLEKDENNKIALLNIAIIYRNYDKKISIEILNKLLKNEPNSELINNFLFNLYFETMDYVNAEKIVCNLIQIKPFDASYKVFKADVLVKLYKYLEAQKIYIDALEKNPDNLHIKCQLAKIYSIYGKINEAENLLKNNLDDEIVLNEYSLLCCKNQELQKVKDGFLAHLNWTKSQEEIENRTKKFFYKLGIVDNYNVNENTFLSFKDKIHNKDEFFIEYQKKEWKNENLKNSTLLIYSKHGVGDLIMCARYLKKMKNLASKIIISIPNSCIELFKFNFPEIEIYSDDTLINSKFYDYACSFFSLICHLDIDLKNIEYSTPYLKVSDELINEKSKLNQIKDINKKKVGIFWQGNPCILVNRSIKLKYFEPILSMSNFQFYSFQISNIDFDSEKYKKSVNLIDLAPLIRNYSDTAAFLKNIDLLITIDTSIAHLAGALGIKTYLLLPLDSEWRWFYDTEKTMWYDSIKIFKQEKPDDWKSVIERVKNELTRI
jgi:tetratricopeptide (TPR) repeat protein